LGWEVLGCYLIYAKSSINLRENNEDSYKITEFRLFPGGESILLAVVADGMGGLEHGEHISSQVVKNLAMYIFEALSDITVFPDNEEEAAANLADILNTAIVRTNCFILRMIENNNWKTAGSTVTAALIKDDILVASNVGDSPIFIHNAGKGAIKKVSEDHTVTQKLLLAGLISRETARYHEGKNTLVSYIGSGSLPEVLPDYRLKMEYGDIILICSDGAVGDMEVDELSGIINKSGPENLKDLADNILIESSRQGEKDNQTIIILQYTKAERGFIYNVLNERTSFVLYK
jgi:PPM family protein phosphatase